MSDTDKRHWAYRLPDLLRGETPNWAREAVAKHRHPEYWAACWGWSDEAVTDAKKASASAQERPDPVVLARRLRRLTNTAMPDECGEQTTVRMGWSDFTALMQAAADAVEASVCGSHQ